MTKMVIVMRKDLNMRKGKMCTQAAHSSLKIFFDRANIEKTIVSERDGNMHTASQVDALQIPLNNDMVEWARDFFTKICVGVGSEQELLDVYHKALQAKLPVALIKDAGKTEFKEPTLTCLAIGPAKAELIDKITGELKLL